MIGGNGSDALAAEPQKVGGGLRTLMRHREQGLARFLPDLRQVLAVVDKLGGANVLIWFDRKLRDEEVKSLENGFSIKFNRIDGKIQNWSIPFSLGGRCGIYYCVPISCGNRGHDRAAVRSTKRRHRCAPDTSKVQAHP
ncbi:MAG: hypothetical protein HY673_10180 [Chloroflexi bacterium]|nr:hypothetical protein [Chloroflexota bacterium]